MLEDLLYYTENYIQYLLITSSGKQGFSGGSVRKEPALMKETPEIWV